jgi:hypothetical protein
MDEVTSEIETRAAAAFANPAWETLELRRTIARTREEVDALLLTPLVLETVNLALDAATREAATERPDRYEVGEHLGAAAHTLNEAGALVGAGTGVVQALRRAVELLGPAGLATLAPAL